MAFLKPVRCQANIIAFGRLIGVSALLLFTFSCSESQVASNNQITTEEGRSLMNSREIHTAMAALSPRNGGYADINNIESLKLAIFNAQENGVTYNFELYADSQMAELIKSAGDIPKSNVETYTAWDLGQYMLSSNVDGSGTLFLENGKIYYWRAQAVLDGDPQEWTSLYSFEVRNLCDIPGTQYAEHVIEVTDKQNCELIAYIDPEAALGPPDAAGQQPVGGFLSLGFSGSITVELGKTAYDDSGYDIRVYEQTSSEWIEVFAGNSEIGPWYSMGVTHCPDYCDFDLGRTGLPYSRYIRIEDMLPASFLCHKTSGADIDAVVVLNQASGSAQCPVDVLMEESNAP